MIVDASFRTAKARAAAEALASAHNVPFRLLECVAPPAVCRARLAARERAGGGVSDATSAVYDAFTAGYEPIVELCPTEHVRIDTGTSSDEALEQAKRVVATWPRGLVQ